MASPRRDLEELSRYFIELICGEPDSLYNSDDIIPDNIHVLVRPTLVPKKRPTTCARYLWEFTQEQR